MVSSLILYAISLARHFLEKKVEFWMLMIFTSLFFNVQLLKLVKVTSFVQRASLCFHVSRNENVS